MGGEGQASWSTEGRALLAPTGNSRLVTWFELRGGIGVRAGLVTSPLPQA